MHSSMINIGIHFSRSSFEVYGIIVAQIVLDILINQYLHIHSSCPVRTYNYIRTNANMCGNITIGVINLSIATVISNILSKLPLGMIQNEFCWGFDFGCCTGLGASVKAYRNKKESKEFHILLTYAYLDVTCKI